LRDVRAAQSHPVHSLVEVATAAAMDALRQRLSVLSERYLAERLGIGREPCGAAFTMNMASRPMSHCGSAVAGSTAADYDATGSDAQGSRTTMRFRSLRGFRRDCGSAGDARGLAGEVEAFEEIGAPRGHRCHQALRPVAPPQHDSFCIH